MTDLALLDEHIPGWESLTPIQYRQAVWLAPPPLRDRLRAIAAAGLPERPATPTSKPKSTP